MIEPLYDTSRVRAAISISPDGQLHLGHLFIIVCAQEIAKKHDIECHLRFDDIYALVAKSWENYPGKNNPRWENEPINPHVPLPGRSIWEMRRPRFMRENQVKNNVKQLESLGFEFDKIYSLTDTEQEVRMHLEDSNYCWLADMPVYFTEDLVWKNTHLCRGEDWKIDGEHGYWVMMQEFFLKTIKQHGYTLYYLPHVTTPEGEKISKSNKDHSGFMLNNMSHDEVNEWIDALRKRAKNILS